MSSQDHRSHARCRRHFLRGVVVLTIVLLAPVRGFPAGASAPGIPGGGTDTGGTNPRDDEPVILAGARFPELDGTLIAETGMFVYDPSSRTYRPIPFQWDERVDKVFNEGTAFEFHQLLYDFDHEEDGRIDADDELAFMYRDAGQRAPDEAPWPRGAGNLRYEIRVVDPRPGAHNPPRWVYLFTGTGLATSPDRYVDWNLLPAGSVQTSRFELTWEDRWLLTEYRVLPPCGSGNDLIDRFKGRAVPVEGNTEDEEGWNGSSWFLGGLLGPVRAIRAVRGAASGANTIHVDLVYGTFWERQLTLRVHPLVSCKLYFDWLPRGHATLYTPRNRDGLVIDGHPDPEASQEYVTWNVVAGDGGGMAVAWHVPPPGHYDRKEAWILDDASVNDQTPMNPHYGDDDDSLYGAHGVKLVGIKECNVEGIAMRMRVYPLCDGEGNASLGDVIGEMQENPIRAEVTAEWENVPAVRSLRVHRQGDDVVLTWESHPDADGYRVYRANDPSLGYENWDLAGETSGTSWTDAGAANGPGFRCWSVVGVRDGQQGPW